MIELHHATVFEAFRASAQRYAGHPFLHILPETAQIYGVPAGTLTYARCAGRSRAAGGDLPARRLRSRSPGRPAAGEPAGVLPALAGAQRAGRVRRADQRRDALGRARVPDGPQRDLPGRHARAARRRSAGRCEQGRDASWSSQRPRPSPTSELRRLPPPHTGAPRRGHRVRPALHLRHDRTSQRLRADQRVLPAGGRVVQPHRRHVRRAAGHRSADHAAADGAHERHGLLHDGDDPGGRLHRSARPLPPRHLVAQRARIAGDHRPLSRGDALDADGRRAVAGRPRASRALRLRRRRRQAPACTLRGTLRLPAARSMGHDRDRDGCRDHRQPRAAPRRHRLLRATGTGRRGAGCGRSRQRRGCRHPRRTAGASGRLQSAGVGSSRST